MNLKIKTRTPNGYSATHYLTKSITVMVCGKKKNSGFTVIELLVVISIVGLLASVILVSLNSAREKAQVVAAGQTQLQMLQAVEIYFDDMGFYPPDVGRGWDPGFSQALPSNSDTGQSGATPPCGHCPSNWVTIVQANWRGPYMASYPDNTPWNGEYDYNYWGSGATRYGCVLPPGMYMGVQGDYSNQNTIPATAEQKMLDQGFDGDGCLNGESQMLILYL